MFLLKKNGLAIKQKYQFESNMRMSKLCQSIHVLSELYFQQSF